MAQGLFERFRVVDTDTHITEPPDVWTSRVASKWGDLVPHVKRVEGRDLWIVGGEPGTPPGMVTMAGFDGTFPDCPQTWEALPESAYDPHARLRHMDAEGIFAEVLYPNVGGFGSGGFLRLKERDLMLECVRAYNDFLIDWTRADTSRLIPVMATPFWDVGETVREIERCAALGHKAVLFGSQPQDFGEPTLGDSHWEPVWAAAEAAGLSISFHIGSGSIANLFTDVVGMGVKTAFARASSLIFIDNVRCIIDTIFSGICHRHPDLRFVSVESGAGWIPSALEAMDWQWRNSGVQKEHPEYDLLPSEYFRRQIYGCFWFENEGARSALEQYPDNILYETDFPHPTCMHPGPATPAEHPRAYAERVLGDLPEPTLEKVFWANAAKIYHLEA
jgi:predicted TIM-barrel fold metal-dependent hydrolase